MTLILYFGNLCTTRKAAEELSSHFNEVEVVDGYSKAKLNYSRYDEIIVGTNIRMGKPNKLFQKWIKKNASLMIDVFIICADDHQKNNYMANIKEKYTNVKTIAYFGGELNPEGARGLSKKVILSCIQEFNKRGLDLPSLHLDRIEDFAQSITNN